MKLAIICANGKAGRLITKEALERGHDVTAFVRGENRSAFSAISSPERKRGFSS